MPLNDLRFMNHLYFTFLLDGQWLELIHVCVSIHCYYHLAHDCLDILIVIYTGITLEEDVLDVRISDHDFQLETLLV